MVMKLEFVVLLYPVPLLLIVNDRTPPSPATADISALATIALPLKSVTATDTGFLYPEPNVDYVNIQMRFLIQHMHVMLCLNLNLL